MNKSPTPEELTQLRTESGMTRYEAAEFISVHKSDWVKWERGKAEMPYHDWQRFNWKLEAKRINKGYDMNISLDYDDTYTRDPIMWNQIITMMRMCGHRVYVVTMRYESEGYAVKAALEGKVDGIYFTSRQAKAEFMYSHHAIKIDVWIDDQPFFVLHGAARTDQTPAIED